MLSSLHGSLSVTLSRARVGVNVEDSKRRFFSGCRLCALPVFALGLFISRLWQEVAKLCSFENGPVAQRLEQGTHNPLVPGSNPGGPTQLSSGKRGRAAKNESYSTM